MNSQANFAVLLNPNARRVSDAVRNRIGEIVHPEHVYLSETENEAPALVEGILNRGYDTVFTGGGDGTVTQFINMLPDAEEAPRVGILRLGTGNAMAGIVSSGNPLADLKTFASNPTTDAYTLPLCEAEGTRFAFAGLGLDAQILNDYRTMKSTLTGEPFQSMLHNVGGYLVSVFGMTVPRMAARWLKRHRVDVTITNTGSDAYVIERTPMGGQIGRTIASGDVMYEGPANAVMFGTCPFYGYNLKMLPFAGIDQERFTLRVSNVPSAKIIGNMGKLWRGTFDHPRLFDFNADSVHMQFSEPMPYQLAGEAMGYREELSVGQAKRPVELVRFI